MKLRSGIRIAFEEEEKEEEEAAAKEGRRN